MTVYPLQIDTDLELPEVQNNVTQIDASSINNLRDAILAVEKTLGANIQGNLTDLETRISSVIDADGNILVSALNNLPQLNSIVNSQVSVAAGIEESKLSLTFSTSYLKGQIDSVNVNITALQGDFGTLSNKINSHILGQSYFHDGYAISLSLPVFGQSDVESALNDVANSLTAHENSIAAAHTASAITVDTNTFVSNVIHKSSTDVQKALTDVANSYGSLGITHVDDFHSPGVFKEIAAGDAYNSHQLIISSATITYTVTDGYGVVTFPIATLLDGYVNPGDILVISGTLDAGNYQISDVGPINFPLGSLPVLTTNQLTIFHIFQETNTATASIYKPAFIATDACPLAVSARATDASIVDSLSVLRPHSARIKSLGFDGTIIESAGGDGYHLGLKVGVGPSLFRTIDIPDAYLYRLSASMANPVDSFSVAERINAYVSQVGGSHFPITAYRIGDELAIAHNLVGTNYTLEVLDGYSGNFALGFDAYGSDVVGKTITGNFGYNYSINGKSLGRIDDLLDGYAITPDGINFSLYSSAGLSINPLDFGIIQGSVMNITGCSSNSTDAYGSYTVLTSTTSTVSLFAGDAISPDTVNVKISSADVALSVLTNSTSYPGLIQLYADSNHEILLHQRLTIEPNSLGSGVEITNISDSFPEGTVISVDNTGSTYTFQLISGTLAGDMITLNSNFAGSFKLYHPNNLDYLIITINPITGSVLTNISNLNISLPLPEDEALLLCTAYFNGQSTISSVVDNRQFGNIGPANVRDDLTDLISRRPISELRDDGIVRGFDIANAESYDIITGMQALPLTGGVAYVDGSRIATQTQKVILRSYDSSHNLITANKIIGINEFGTIQVFDYDLDTLLLDGYETISGKVLPLYQVSLIAGLIDGYTDIRRFINTLDNKVDLVVDNSLDNLIGSFRTLEGALLYAQSYPNNEKLVIKIINAVYPAVPVVVPDNVSIIGSAPYGGTKQKIVATINISAQPFITLMGNNRLADLNITSSGMDVDGYLIQVAGSNVVIENCNIGFGPAIGSANDIAIDIVSPATKDVRIVDNKIDNVYSGVVADTMINELLIDRNHITNITSFGTAFGIELFCADRDGYNIQIINNNIDISPIQATSGILIQVIDGHGIDEIKINGNHISDGYMVDGIRINNRTQAATGVINKLFITDNTISGINFGDIYVNGIYFANTTNAFIRNNVLANIGGDGYNYNYGIYADDGQYTSESLEFAEITGNTIKDSNLSSGIHINTLAGNITTKVRIVNNNLLDINWIPNVHADINIISAYIYGLTSNSDISDNILTGCSGYGIYWGSNNSSWCKISGNSVANIDETGVCIYLNLSGSPDFFVTGNITSGVVGVGGYTTGSGITNNYP